MKKEEKKERENEGKTWAAFENNIGKLALANNLFLKNTYCNITA